MSLQDEPRHPSEASARGDAAAADTSCSEVPEAGVVLGEKQSPRAPHREMPGRHP